MELTMIADLAVLQHLTMQQLRARYAEVFGEQPSSCNRVWMIKRIAWRLQALAEGGLSERARQRAAELANDADLRLTPPRIEPQDASSERITVQPLTPRTDERLPPPGSLLVRPYKGRTIQVLILNQGFAYEGKVYASLSAVAKAVTGSHTNGFLFFRNALNQPQEKRS